MKTMEDKSMDEKESLELITQMIQNTRRNLDTGSGNLFLLWGYVGVLVTLTVCAGVYLTKSLVWLWGFWGIPLIGYSWMPLLLRKRPKTVKSYIDKVLDQVWMIDGLVCMIVALGAIYTNRYEIILPLTAILMSLGSLMTGCIIRYTTFFIFPAIGFAWGMKHLFDALDGESSILWFTGTVILALIIPGHILNNKARKEAGKGKCGDNG